MAARGRNLKWIMNIKSPYSKDFEKWVVEKSPKVDKKRAIELYTELYKQYIIGEPKSTPAMTVDALKQKGFVGGYVDPQDTRAIEDESFKEPVRNADDDNDEEVEEIEFDKKESVKRSDDEE